MVYLLIGSFFCILQAAKAGGSSYSIILFSLIITYGVYMMSSLIALDPWHMIFVRHCMALFSSRWLTVLEQSFGPYMLLSPTYVNILNV